MDLTYLHDANQGDFNEFTGGKRFTDEEVYAEIGRPSEWTHRAKSAVFIRTEEQAANVAEQLLSCHRWDTPSDHTMDQNT